MIFDLCSKHVRRRQVQCFWAGIATAVIVAAYRVYVTVAQTLHTGTPPWLVSLDTWTTNGFILWSLTLFVLAWLFWRDTRHRQDELETVVRSIIPDVLLVTGKEGQVLMCNPAVQTMFGFTPEEMRLLTTVTLLQDRIVTGAEHEIYERLHHTGYELHPATGIRKDGSSFPVELTTAKLLEQNGSVMLIRDITERNRVEQLRENLTHVLRNPLFGISGNLHLVLSLSKNLSEDAQTSVRVALDFVRDMGEMLHCLVDVTQFEAGEWPLHPADCDVSLLVDRALAPLATLVNEKRHTVVWPHPPAPFNCDPELIERVILNLLRNAIEATPSGGQIEIRLEPAPDRLRLSVIDNGPGVPREFHDMIFQKFGQTPDGRKSKRRSSGLGLTFCKLAIEAQGGTVGVKSNTDQGSTFWFELPASK
jgi:PAS domain S-box-containing protein